MKTYLPFILAAIFITSCKTELVYMSVMTPAPVTISPVIKKAGIINRSQASEETKNIDAVEQALTLEGPKLDKEGAEASIAGLTDELNNNNRFTKVTAIKTDLRTTGAGVFPAPLTWDIVDKICKENDVEILFSLEFFDTDTKITYETRKTTVRTPLGNIPGIEHQANMQTFVKTGWRIYDPAGRIIVDEYPYTEELTFSGRGINPVAAAAALIGRKDAVMQASTNAGHAYALRIIPTWIRVSRDYYVKGSDNFKIAKRKAQTGKWDEAAKLWEMETGNPKPKIAGRACYNMAIINEINGDLDAAIKWAQKAYEDYGNKLALRYVRILENRKINDSVLKTQNVQ